MFKVGDRVSNINEYETHKGEKGTIIEVHETYQNPYLVEYDNYINGHSGNESVIGKDGHCWWEREGTIEKIRKGDNMNLLDKICEELGIDIDKQWTGSDGCEYKITHNGVLVWVEHNTNPTIDIDCFEKIDDISRVLTGELRPVWKPKVGEQYYVPEIRYEELYEYWTWYNDEFDNRLLERGLVFKTKEEAEECSLNLLALCKEGV